MTRASVSGHVYGAVPYHFRYASAGAYLNILIVRDYRNMPISMQILG